MPVGSKLLAVCSVVCTVSCLFRFPSGSRFGSEQKWGVIFENDLDIPFQVRDIICNDLPSGFRGNRTVAVNYDILMALICRQGTAGYHSRKLSVSFTASPLTESNLPKYPRCPFRFSKSPANSNPRLKPLSMRKSISLSSAMSQRS